VVAKFTDTNTSATAGNFTATVYWGDGTSSLGTVTADPNGGFNVTAMHTYAADNDFGFGRFGPHALFSVTIQDSTTGTSTTAFGLATITSGSSSGSSSGSASAQNQLFVTELYQSLLQRLPDVGGLGYWTTILDQGTSRSAVATQIEQSQEYRGDQVNAIYQKMLAARPTRPGWRLSPRFWAMAARWSKCRP
jgi:hypothetical protein